MVNECGLSDPSPGNDGNDVDFLLCPRTIQKSDILLSAKISLPVTGNLANEIFFGPSLAGGLRVPIREAVEGVFCRLWRVILCRVSMAPVILGIAFSSSFGVRKRCTGSFSRRTTTGCGRPLSRSSGKGA